VKTNNGRSVPQRICDFLVGDGQMYCDPCLRKHTGLKWREQVNLVTATLAVTPYFKRSDGECCACHQMTRVVQAVPRSTADDKPACREP
jgi:hypothetical protein